MRQKRHKNITQEVIDEVNKRANRIVGVGRCESCRGIPDFRGLQFAEPRKKMGGTTRVFTGEMVRRLCARCHFREDHNIREVESKPMWS